MQISVIIPTRNRQPSLARALECLAAQDHSPGSLEVIVIDDGSDDGTWPWLQAQTNAFPYRLRSLRQSPNGPAAARNRGLEAAQGEFVLFLGDDIYATPQLLSRHLAWHATWSERSTAVLGQVQWAPGLHVNSLMRWMEAGGAQWRLEGLEPGSLLDYHWFITANISVRRAILMEAGGFDEGFPDAALEDTELGYRLLRLGLEVRYAPDALAYHWHPTSLEGFLARSRKQGQAAVYFARRWSELEEELLDPRSWFSDCLPVQRYLLSRVVRWRRFIALLGLLARWLADRPQGAFQPWASRIYWLVVYHNRLLGITSV